MATHRFTYDGAASLNAYLRIHNTAGLVLDFNDNTFKALGSATTPYVTMTEVAAAGGTGQSRYYGDVDLDLVNATGDRSEFTATVCNNGTPAASDTAVSGALGFAVQFGRLGIAEVVAQGECNVKSTAGSTAQVTAWLEHGGQTIDVGTNGGTVFTAATSDVCTSTAHGLSNGDVLLLTTSNTLPAGLSLATPYYVIDRTDDTFKLSASSGGSAVDITDTGTGVHKWHQPTATVTLREHGSGSNLFAKSLTAADLSTSGRFEGEQSSPGFTDDREYEMTVAIVENGVTHTSIHSRVVIG